MRGAIDSLSEPTRHFFWNLFVTQSQELSNRPALSGGGFRTLLLALFVPFWTVLWGGWCMVAGWVKSAALFRFGLRLWGRGILAVGGIRIEKSYAPGFTPKPFVFVANHQSALDIPILIAACAPEYDVRFMAKESLFKIPFLGWGIAGNGFIPIRRENARHAANTFKEIAAKNSADYSYIVFPEGTRSPDGRLRDFKRGAIALVLQLQRPLVPVTIIDACRANPKGRWLVRPGTVRVVFHAPITPETLAVNGDERAVRDAVTQNIFDAVASALPEDQRPA